MQYFFLTYNSPDYFLTHVYEQLIAIQLMHYGYLWEKGNLGTHYIEINWKNPIPIDEIKRIIDLPDLNPIAVESAYSIVSQETLDNLINRPVVEILNFRIAEPNKIRDYIQIPITEDKINQFLTTERSSRSYIVTNGHTISTQLNWTPQNNRGICDNFTPPFDLYMKETKKYYLTYKTNATNSIEGTAFELLGKNIIQNWKNNNDIIGYQTILDPFHNLWISFDCAKESVDKVINHISTTANSLSIQRPPLLPIPKKLNEIYEVLDWCGDLDNTVKKYQSERGTKWSFKLIGPEIILDK